MAGIENVTPPSNDNEESGTHENDTTVEEAEYPSILETNQSDGNAHLNNE